MLAPFKQKIQGLEGITRSIFWKKSEQLKIGSKMHFFTNVSKNAVKSGQETSKIRVSPDIEPTKITRDTKVSDFQENAC